MVALKHSSTNVPISISQEVYLRDDQSLDNCHNSHHGDNNNDDEDDAWLVESTVDSDCIDFGSCVHHQDPFPDAALFYNPYNMFMPQVKELVSIVVASKNCREHGVVAVEQALDKLISDEKANLASVKPPPIGGVVSSCPVRKVRKKIVCDEAEVVQLKDYFKFIS
jgi:hypothetical protein